MLSVELNKAVYLVYLQWQCLLDEAVDCVAEEVVNCALEHL